MGRQTAETFTGDQYQSEEVTSEQSQVALKMGVFEGEQIGRRREGIIM